MNEQSWTDHPRIRAWLQEREKSFAQWAAAHPGVWDFSVESIDRLEEVLRAEFASYEEITAAKSTPAVMAPAWYFGEVCVRAGAVWRHNLAAPIDADTWPGPVVGIEGDPRLEPDYDRDLFKDSAEDYLPATGPDSAVCENLLFPEGLREIAEEFASFGKRLTFMLALGDNPRLRAWLQKQEEAFPQWAAAHPGLWDFSPDSIDRLQEVLTEEFTPDENIEAARYAPAVTVPAWYLGETCIRAGAVWKYSPNEPVEPTAAAQNPDVGVPGDPWDDPDYQNFVDDEYLPSAFLVNELCSMFVRGPDWRLRSIVEQFDTWRRNTDGGRHNPVSTRFFLTAAAQYQQQLTNNQLWPDHPRLRTWLDEQEQAFPHWAATHPGNWDFSPDSLDQLHTTLQTEFPSPEHITARTTAVTVPAWYLGEVCARAGAIWKHHYTTPTEHGAPIDAETWLAPLIGTPNNPDNNPHDHHPTDIDPTAEIRGILTRHHPGRLRTIADRFTTRQHDTDNHS
jgi:hypothetical protein